MREVDWHGVTELLNQLYETTAALEDMFEGRSFSPDGHLVGSIGEVVAAYMFDLRLVSASNKGYDALSNDGRKRQVEIKFTQGDRIGIRHKPQHLIVLQRLKHGHVTVVYNGPGERVWKDDKTSSNGQKAVSVAALRKLNNDVLDSERLTEENPPPI
jgi:hypothetical protein